MADRSAEEIARGLLRRHGGHSDTKLEWLGSVNACASCLDEIVMAIRETRADAFAEAARTKGEVGGTGGN